MLLLAVKYAPLLSLLGLLQLLLQLLLLLLQCSSRLKPGPTHCSSDGCCCSCVHTPESNLSGNPRKRQTSLNNNSAKP